MSNVRVRYAPSPTGLQHVGGVRTALFNYLFARKSGGAFVLRIEDTDRARSESAYIDNLYDTFRWLGFHWDEGPDTGGQFAPYIQSERSALYKKSADVLLEKGAAYRCFCSSQRLEALRKEQESAKSAVQGYDRHCRGLSSEESNERAKSESYTVRLKIPLPGVTKFNDALLGGGEWNNESVNPDPVLLKSDGFPTYHLANIVDDHAMGVTHVLRAQEWLSSTPLHIILYDAFGWTPPVFCHLPMVMGEDGKKLSKRHGATSIDEFRKNGYLSGALLNYIALLGASYEEGREIWTLAELAERFSLEKLNKAPAVFDYKKLEWFNGEYIKAMTDADLAAAALPFAVGAALFGGGVDAGAEPSAEQRVIFERCMPLVKERVHYLTEIADKLRFIFTEPPAPPLAEFIPKKGTAKDAARALEEALLIAERLCSVSDEEAERIAKESAEKLGFKIGDFLMPVRTAVTGSRVSPPLFASMRLLGLDTCASRLKKALRQC